MNAHVKNWLIIWAALTVVSIVIGVIIGAGIALVGYFL